MKTDFLFFVGEDWTPFSQRGQSMALELANRGHRIFYCEPMLSLPRAVLLSIKGRPLRPLGSPCANLEILRPKLSLYPFRGSRTVALDRLIFQSWLKDLIRRCGIRSDAILYVNMPYWWGPLLSRETLGFGQLVYDCIDDVKVYSRNPRVLEVMARAEAQLAVEADLVLATAGTLKSRMDGFSQKVHLLPNGVDTRRFQAGTYSEPPADLAKLPRPWFGFVGSLYYWIDTQVFEDLAREFPGGSVILMGTSRHEGLPLLLERNANVHYLGTRPYTSVPSYLAAFDVCLNPFRMDDLGDTINPLKTYEYLSMGKPILGSRTQESAPIEDLVYNYSSPEELKVQAHRALAEHPDRASARIRYASDNSWESRVSNLEEWLGLQEGPVGGPRP